MVDKMKTKATTILLIVVIAVVVVEDVAGACYGWGPCLLKLGSNWSPTIR